jgi:hypothetical protein
MGRRACCAKEGVKRGAWTAEEDDILAAYVKAHGEGKWREVPQKAGKASPEFSFCWNHIRTIYQDKIDRLMEGKKCVQVCVGAARAAGCGG